MPIPELLAGSNDVAVYFPSFPIIADNKNSDIGFGPPYRLADVGDYDWTLKLGPVQLLGPGSYTPGPSEIAAHTYNRGGSHGIEVAFFVPDEITAAVATPQQENPNPYPANAVVTVPSGVDLTSLPIVGDYYVYYWLYYWARPGVAERTDFSGSSIRFNGQPDLGSIPAWTAEPCYFHYFNVLQSTPSVPYPNGSQVFKVLNTWSGEEEPIEIDVPVLSEERDCPDGDVTLTWTIGGNHNHTRVFRDGVQISDYIDSPTNTYTDTTADPGVQYTYTVRAYYNEGGLIYEESNVVTAEECVVVLPDIVLTGERDCPSGDADLTWTDGTPYDWYILFRNGIEITGYMDGLLGASDTSSDALSDVSYYVRGYLADGGVEYVQSNTVVLDACDPPDPPVLTVGRACPSGDNTLVWTAVLGAEQYGVFRDAVLLLVTEELAYVDTDALPDETYQYYIEAYDGVGTLLATSNVVTKVQCPEGAGFEENCHGTTGEYEQTCAGTTGEFTVESMGI